jgi:hypothetical protein
MWSVSLRALDREAQDPLRAAGLERPGVIDAIAACEGRHDEGQELVAGVGRTGLAPR